MPESVAVCSLWDIIDLEEMYSVANPEGKAHHTEQNICILT